MSVILGSTGITFPDSTTQTTAATSSGGTVTSVATGTGLTGGTITTTGTISLVTTQGAVGTYAWLITGSGTAVFGSTYAGSGLTPAGAISIFGTGCMYYYVPAGGGSAQSGTWRCMGQGSGFGSSSYSTLFVRIA